MAVQLALRVPVNPAEQTGVQTVPEAIGATQSPTTAWTKEGKAVQPVKVQVPETNQSPVSQRAEMVPI